MGQMVRELGINLEKEYFHRVRERVSAYASKSGVVVANMDNGLDENV